MSFIIKLPSTTLSYFEYTFKIIFDGAVSVPSFISSGLGYVPTIALRDSKSAWTAL
jgi:hypothetical protein